MVGFVGIVLGVWGVFGTHPNMFSNKENTMSGVVQSDFLSNHDKEDVSNLAQTEASKEAIAKEKCLEAGKIIENEKSISDYDKEDALSHYRTLVKYKIFNQIEGEKSKDDSKFQGVKYEGTACYLSFKSKKADVVNVYKVPYPGGFNVRNTTVYDKQDIVYYVKQALDPVVKNSEEVKIDQKVISEFKKN